MRFFAIHDPSGNISRLVGAPDTGPVLRPLQLGQSQGFTQVRLPAHSFDAADRKRFEKLAEITKAYIVEMPPTKPARLVKKASGGGEGRGSFESLTIAPNPVNRGALATFDIVLREPALHVLNVIIVLQPNILLASTQIPPGETLRTERAQIPVATPIGPHDVTALVSQDDAVTTVLNVML
jgi:hypothetical protein